MRKGISEAKKKGNPETASRHYLRTTSENASSWLPLGYAVTKFEHRRKREFCEEEDENGESFR